MRKWLDPDPGRREEDVFSWGTRWWRAQYEIQLQEDETKRSFPVIAARSNARVEWYDVFKEVQSLEPVKQPERPEDWWSYGPHTALARINLGSEKEILNFVNRWGLLGLWEEERYRHKKPHGAQPKPGPQGLSGEEKYSGWYRNEVFAGQEGRHLQAFQEPLDLFKEAAEAYQELSRRLASLSSNESLDVRTREEMATECEWQLTSELYDRVHLRPVFDLKTHSWLFGWECSSLLAWIYLLTFLDLVRGRRFRKCARKKCGRFFVFSDEDRKFCSKACANAQMVADHRARKAQKSQERG